MRRVFKPFFWCLVFLLLLVICDQLLTRIPPVHPAHAAVTEFYRDFRQRLFSIIEIVPSEAPRSIEAVIDQERRQTTGSPTAAPAKPSATAPATPTQPTRYVYADQDGVLQFADSLDEVPKAYRNSAEPLED